jgi:hypothetical protein
MYLEDFQTGILGRFTNWYTWKISKLVYLEDLQTGVLGRFAFQLGRGYTGI